MAIQFLEPVRYDAVARLVSIEASVDGETVRISTSVKVLEQAYGMFTGRGRYVEEYFSRIARADIEKKARARLEGGARDIQFAVLRDIIDIAEGLPDA